MSVLKNKRSESAIKVITQGDKIVEYTLRMLCNESIFPKKSRWLMSGKISMDDVRAQYNSWTAHVKRTNSHGIRKQMNQYYSDLFGENPTVKL